VWFLVQVVKGSKALRSRVLRWDNHVLISDTTEMVISGPGQWEAKAIGFEVRKGNEAFIIPGTSQGAQPPGSLDRKFTALAKQMGALGRSQTEG